MFHCQRASEAGHYGFLIRDKETEKIRCGNGSVRDTVYVYRLIMQSMQAA